MKSILLFTSCLLFVDCKRPQATSFVFLSLKPEIRLRLVVSGSGAQYSLEKWGEKPTWQIPRWICFDEQFTRTYVGWSADARTISLLACGNDGPQLLRRTFFPPSLREPTKDWDSLHDADKNLMSSLRLTRQRAPERGRPQDDEFKWFCLPYGETAFNQYSSIVDGVKEVSIPYQETK